MVRLRYNSFDGNSLRSCLECRVKSGFVAAMTAQMRSRGTTADTYCILVSPPSITDLLRTTEQ